MPVPKSKKAGAKKTGATRKASTTGKKAAKKKKAAKPTTGDTAVTIDRRSRKERRTTPDRRKKSVPVTVERRKLERRVKVNRRRQIDPTTCERDYTCDEIEFMNALDEYKRASGRMFPTCSEILEVLRKLGYERRRVQEPPQAQASQPSDEAAGLPACEPDSQTAYGSGQAPVPSS